MSFIEMARRLLARGQPLPVDLAIRLLDLGYDVDALEGKRVRYRVGDDEEDE